MSNTISIESSEVEIIHNDYKLETDQEKNENSSNNEIKTKNSNTMHKTDELFIPMDDNKKDGDKRNANGPKKDFTVYGYYVREPIWVNFGFQRSGFGGVSYDPYTRNSFICLVFLIVFTMLVATAGWGTLCLYVQIIRDIYEAVGSYIIIAAIVVMVGMSYIMACLRCARVLPCNIICLVIAVIAMSAIVGYLVIRFRTILVVFAVIATAAVVLVCFLLAFTRFDFTKCLLFVIVAGVVVSVLFICVTLATFVMGESFPILSLVILVIATLVEAVMLTIEIQTVLGGKAVELEEDDYAYAAYMIYTSIVDLFIKLVEIFGILEHISE